MKRFRWIVLAAAMIFLLGATLMYTAWRHSYRLDLQRVTFTSPGLDARLDGVTILFATDIHMGSWGWDARRMDKLVTAINELKPDVILLGGDYVGGRCNGAEIFYAGAAGLRARYGVFAVAGNHDYWEDRAHLPELFEQANLHWLRNRNERIEINGAGLRIAGIDDFEEYPADFEAAYQGVPADDFLLLLTHNPDVFGSGSERKEQPFVLARPQGAAIRPDLALAGHTHDGQVRFFGRTLGVPSSYGDRFLAGWQTVNKVPLFISPGVGVSVAPFRLGTTAQLHLITLRSASVGSESVALEAGLERDILR
jgi:predicted MPP superfamily phosphohydrolase